jgi:hypothetical protein
MLESVATEDDATEMADELQLVNRPTSGGTA